MSSDREVSTDFALAVIAERVRIAEIIRFGQSIDREKTAMRLAFETDVGIALVRDILPLSMSDSDVLKAKTAALGVDHLKLVAKDGAAI